MHHIVVQCAGKFKTPPSRRGTRALPRFAHIFCKNISSTGRVNALKLSIGLYFMDGIVSGIKKGLEMLPVGLDLTKTGRLNPMGLFSARHQGQERLAEDAQEGARDRRNIIIIEKVLGTRAVVPKKVSLDRIVKVVSRGYAIKEAQLRAPGRGRQASQTRSLIAWLAMQTGAATLEQVAARFGRDATTLSRLAGRLETRRRASQPFAAQVSRYSNAIMQA